ncbi:LysR family transcriptional regulator [Salinicoccus sp. ID82-1]|uniref:LysR family transcriptional regulator n=1 Tax=Salinicoccus sp. ID82-1 TaxID=2820269 RepID=UPI001F17F8F4|nr:LysR family transcriptional regulator [Salinicoccus sp. ID82-1]MCG1008473.1 LysR family transcriptional regulator [Salinicoccus sp. ID82-1]
MELRHIRYFQAVAKHLHFSKAAKELNISQPPLSKQIRLLEEELGVKLFKRNNRNVELTEAGIYFANSCKFILNLLDKEIETTREMHKGELGTITLGFSGSVVYNILPTVIKELKRRYPNLNLIVEQHTSSEQEKHILNGNINLGMLVPPTRSEKIETLLIKKEGFLVVLPKTHEIAQNQEPIDLSLLKEEKFIMTRETSGKGYYDSIIALCKSAGFYPNIVQNAQEQQTIISLVASELGIAVVPESSASILNEEVVFKKINQSHKKSTALAWHKDSQSPAVKIFKELVEDLINSGRLK